MPKENTTIYILLGLLNHEELSGYDIKKRIDIMISNFWEIGYGQIYPTLARLEKEGLVTKRTSETSNGPEKNLYSITGAGRDLLTQWLKVPEQKEYTKYEILVKLFFGSLVPTRDNINRIEAFKARHSENMKMIQLFKQNLEQILNQDEDHVFFYISVLFGEKIYKAYLEWADEAVRLLNERSGTLIDNKEGDSDEKTED